MVTLSKKGSRRLSALAEVEGLDEQSLAHRLVDAANAHGRHVGFLLFSPPGELRAPVYIASLAGLTLFGCLTVYSLLGDLAAALLLLVPLCSLVKGIADFLLLRFLRPRPLPPLL
jgi:hypothetical protein